MQVFHYREEKYISKYKFQIEVFCQSLLLLQKRKWRKMGIRLFATRFS